MSLDDVLAVVCDHLTSLRNDRPLLVGIDGIDASGKTTFADSLATALDERGREVVRVSIDDFQQPRVKRYARGRSSPEGYYQDSFDVDAFRRHVLALRDLDDGPFTLVRRVFDLVEDCPVTELPTTLARDEFVLCDGVFLQRPEFSGRWDFVIFLHVDVEEALRRALRRDATDDVGALRKLYEARYMPAQRMYVHAASPDSSADLVIDNSDVESPRIVDHR